MQRVVTIYVQKLLQFCVIFHLLIFRYLSAFWYKCFIGFMPTYFSRISFLALLLASSEVSFPTFASVLALGRTLGKFLFIFCRLNVYFQCCPHIDIEWDGLISD
jgi:hypothetical protein